MKDVLTADANEPGRAVERFDPIVIGGGEFLVPMIAAGVLDASLDSFAVRRFDVPPAV